MKDFVFITGNQNKVEHLAMWLGHPVKHHKVDLEEIQSLDAEKVAEHKAKQAYELLKEPTLIEDVSLTFEAMGRLPGTYIKWFLEEIGTEGLCKLADGLEHREANATVLYAFYDGNKMHYFGNTIKGTIAPQPRGNYGFGWDPIFIPEGSKLTYAEMKEGEDDLSRFSVRARAVEKLQAYLHES